MSVLPILTWPDPRLSKICTDVGEEDLRQLIADMFDTLYASGGRGLAAPQVGVMRRLFVMDADWKQGKATPEVFADPKIVVRERQTEVAPEGCLSIPGLEVPVTRPVAVTLRWRDGSGDFHMRDFDGFEARCIQHEIDHLDGKVTLDYLSSADRTQFLSQYEGSSL